MSFIPSREKIMMDRFIKAEEVRKIKKTCHLSKGTNGSNIRIKLEIASERVRSLENSLKAISGIREKRRYLKELYDSSEKLNKSLLLKEKIKKCIHNQELKLNHSQTPKKDTSFILPNIKKICPSNESVNVKNLISSVKGKSKTPETLRNSFKFLSPKIMKKS